MSINPKVLIPTSIVPTTVASQYTVPALATAIVDKFTATNITSSAATLSVYLVTSGGSIGTSTLIIDSLSIAAHSIVDITQLQNQILATGDAIASVASTSSAIVQRASGREVT